ncbi:MAG: tetratricopeptide repeat protein [Nitrospirota bacterium]|nr:tetratricopeptide repeat protein [Nitrospirota bacterium]
MRLQVSPFMAMVLMGALIGGCDSSQVSEPTATDETATSEESMAESSMDAAMETASSGTEPEALLAAEDAGGAGDNNEGVDHYQQGHWDVAQEHFQKSVAANANLAEAHYNMALTLDKLGNHGEATNHFKMALDLAPDNPGIADSGILKAHVGG